MDNAITRFKEVVAEVRAGSIDKLVEMNQTTFHFLMKQRDLINSVTREDVSPKATIRVNDELIDGVISPVDPPKISDKGRSRKKQRR